MGMGVTNCPGCGAGGLGVGGRWFSTPYPGYQAKNWRRDKDYVRANCHDGMSEDEIKKALHMSATTLRGKAWQLEAGDVSAFSDERAEEDLIEMDVKDADKLVTV